MGEHIIFASAFRSAVNNHVDSGTGTTAGIHDRPSFCSLFHELGNTVKEKSETALSP